MRPAPRSSPSARLLIVLIVLFIAGAVFRFAIVHSFRSGSPDAYQYHRLAFELAQNGRYAFGPEPAPLTHSRVPGYPVFSALVIDHGAVAWEQHLVRAPRWNVVFDLLSALLAFLWLFGERHRAAACAAWIGVLLCPLLFLLTTYPLTESLATLLSVASVYLTFRAHRHRSPGFAAAAGLAAAAALLVRTDCVTVLPACLLLLAGLLRLDRSAGLKCAAAFCVAFTVLYAPWPARNLVRFGAPYFEGAEWPAQAGEPLPTGFISWLRTWCTALPGESHLNNLFVFGHRFSATAPGIVLPQMVDGPAERARLLQILQEAGARGLTPTVDRGFAELARERRQRRWLRYFVTLPAKRVVRLWGPPVRGELPMRVSWLGLPERWGLFSLANWISGALALAGVAALVWRRERLLLASLTLPILARTVLHAFAVPQFVGQRYLAEAMPFILCLAGIGLLGITRLVRGLAVPGESLPAPEGRLRANGAVDGSIRAEITPPRARDLSCGAGRST